MAQRKHTEAVQARGDRCTSGAAVPAAALTFVAAAVVVVVVVAASLSAVRLRPVTLVDTAAVSAVAVVVAATVGSRSDAAATDLLLFFRDGPLGFTVASGVFTILFSS